MSGTFYQLNYKPLYNIIIIKMTNFSLTQLIIIVLLFTLIFGDLPKIVNIIKKTIKDFTKTKPIDKKKGN